MGRLSRKIFLLLFLGFLAGAWSPGGVEAREVQLLMALDISGSMKVTDPQRLLPRAAHIMVELLDEKDRLGILTFEDVTLNPLPLGTLNPAQRRKGFQALARLQPRGLWTNIHQVTAEALKAFGPPGQAKRALLLISDGQMDINPRKGNSKAFVDRVHQEIIPAFKKAGIPIYAVAFTPASDQVLLKALAEETGGRFLLIPAARDLHQAFVKFYEDLKGPQLAPLVGNHFVIDPLVQEAILVVTRSQQNRAVALETPKGQKLGPASKGIRWFTAPTFDMVTLPKPEPGKWTVSGHKDGEGKIILMTDLKLACPHVPEEAGADEALMAGALLTNKDQPVTAPEVQNQTVFTAELQAEKGKPVQVQMGTPPVEQKELWPSEARVAKLPVFTAPGVWNLQVRALGKTFQRERNFTIKVTTPWYKAQTVSGEGPTQVAFLRTPGRESAKLAGWFNISAPTGGVWGKFVEPQPGGGFRFAFPPDLSGSYLVNAQLTGVTASGRPLVLEPPPLKVNVTPVAAASEIGPKSATAASSPGVATTVSRSRKWLWIALGVAVVVALLGTAAYFFWPQSHRFLRLGFGSPGVDVDYEEMPLEKRNLLLLAQVESLQKERGKLKADVAELTQALEKMTDAKEDLEARLGEPSRQYQEKSKMIRELEQRLEEAEKEAKSVQQEYMALYARSTQEKQELKKS